jgi:hypothetical protein
MLLHCPSGAAKKLLLHCPGGAAGRLYQEQLSQATCKVNGTRPAVQKKKLSYNTIYDVCFTVQMGQ